MVLARMAGEPIERGSVPGLLRDPLLYGVALIAIVVCAPFFRYVQWLGDEGVFLHGAARILGGEALYRDFFEFLPPGSFLAVAGWMKLFGAGFASVRVLAIGVIAAIAALLYAAARLASANRALATTLAIAWVVFSQGIWTVISHHWFTTAAAMASAVALLQALEAAPRRRAAFAAGLAAGAAAMATSSRGALVGLAVLGVLLTLPRAGARLASALAGIVLIPAAMILYLAASGTLTAAIDETILYPARHYAGIQAMPFGSGAGVADAASVAFYPATFALAGAALALGRGAIWREPRFRAALALALAGLLGTYPRPDIFHINFTVPLGGPLFALAATDLLGRLGHHARSTVAALVLGLCLVGVGYALYIRRVVVVGPLRAVPTARGLVVRRDNSWTERLAALVAEIDRVPRGEAFFFYPYSPMLPYLTGRRHVAALDVLTPGYTTPEQFRDACVRVVGEARWVVIERAWTDPAFLRAVWPGMRDPDPPEKRSFEGALALAFDRVAHASPYFELRQRGGAASVALCDRLGAGPQPP